MVAPFQLSPVNEKRAAWGHTFLFAGEDEATKVAGLEQQLREWLLNQNMDPTAYRYEVKNRGWVDVRKANVPIRAQLLLMVAVRKGQRVPTMLN